VVHFDSTITGTFQSTADTRGFIHKTDLLLPFTLQIQQKLPSEIVLISSKFD